MRRFRGIAFPTGCGLVLTVLVLWFAAGNYRSAAPVAHSILRGLALSLGQAIESIVSRDPSLSLLREFTAHDIAFFAVIDANGRVRFHSNTELIGEPLGDQRYREALTDQAFCEQRVRLGTGEEVYETQQRLHVGGETLVLRLALHTWQADQVIQRARNGLTLIVLLVSAAWCLGGLVFWLLRRDEQRKSELARQEQLAQLGALGAVMAHEVRTPLAGIKGYAQLLQERLSDERLHGYAGKIVGESERLEGLVGELLTYVRQEPLPQGTAVLEAVLRDVWEGLATEPAHVASFLVIDGTLDEPVACPADRLRQLFLNLFSNALQAMPAGGAVRGHLERCGDMAHITVADRGPGFPPDLLPRLFTPFFTTRANGSGLGLAVCRKLAEGYGGTIIAANGTNGGAEITLNLPLAKELV